MSKLNAITEIVISKTRTVNLGNYENESVFVSVKVNPMGNPDEAVAEAIAYVNSKIDEEIAVIGGKSINKVASKRIENQTKAETKKEEADNAEEQSKSDEQAEQTSASTKAEVRAALSKVKEEKGNDTYKGVLKEFGAKALSGLEEGQYDAVIAACDELLAEEPEPETTVDDDLDEGDSAVSSDITLEEFKAALKEYNAENGAGSHKAVLKQFDYSGVADIPADKYAEIMAELI